MNKVKLSLIAAAVMAAGGANANLIPNGTVADRNAYDLVPRLLTLQDHGGATSESGAIGILNGSLISMQLGIESASVHAANATRNAGGDLFGLVTDATRFSAPTLGALNWSTASDVGLMFTARENNNRGVNISDVTLKFYNGNNVVAAIDGNFSLASTNPGTGKSGFLVSVDSEQQTFLNSNVFSKVGAKDYRIALESTITGVGGGEDSYYALGQKLTPAVPEPQTYAMMLAGLGLLGFARIRKSRRDKQS